VASGAEACPRAVSFLHFSFFAPGSASRVSALETSTVSWRLLLFSSNLVKAGWHLFTKTYRYSASSPPMPREKYARFMNFTNAQEKYG
jgi:hypothetical protein